MLSRNIFATCLSSNRTLGQTESQPRSGGRGNPTTSVPGKRVLIDPIPVRDGAHAPRMIMGFVLIAVIALLLPACSINVKDRNNKDGNAHVDIKTPVGDLHVSEHPDIKDTGLSVYPGARLAPKETGENKKSANVNLALPGFSLKVAAGEFESDDSTGKVLDYYNKELQRFGKPIECHGKWNGGDADVNTNDKGGLSKPVSCRESGGESVELKVGTEGNQHIVAIKPQGKGTRFALVYVRMHTGKDDTI
jgi:hypothetical protein